ncbi:hypothetical protein LXL04_039033 [Taraxacum kok-saghyz]
MASSSSSSSGLRRATHLDYQHRCNCGLPSRVLTSGTTKNPDRRFLVCNKSQVFTMASSSSSSSISAISEDEAGEMGDVSFGYGRMRQQMKWRKLR